MAAVAPTIVATSMGLNRARAPWQPGPAFAHAADLARPDGTPRLCVLTTAGPDAEQPALRARFRAAFADDRYGLSVLGSLDDPGVDDIGAHLAAQDVIWVDRGNLATALKAWRDHGVDAILRDCWRAGVVLAGESAGSLCWFANGITDSSGTLGPYSNGLGFLPYANCVHYADRRDEFHRMFANGDASTGYATDTGAGLVFQGEKIVAISDRKNAGAYRIQRAEDGTVTETALTVERLKRV
ncbi:peptidase E [Amycolatopsis thailandensis]|uniref:Peptidase E n=1 Tax=Amycolatopsis thailandensis TaxID=589330 RepID=A0A229RVA7_9PSEU|nr:peptidase E [Amycolatopsis thailandensis]OXM50284.1 peptidase E [Amycolatopsis thailandensis]